MMGLKARHVQRDVLSSVNDDDTTTPQNFMDIVPIRKMEHIQEEWQVGFRLPRFKSRFWNRFFTSLGASETYIVRLDRMGSEIWGYINDERTVREILVRLELNHAGEEDLRDRLVHYLKRIQFHEFIKLEVVEKDG